MFTSLTAGGSALERTDAAISSLIDTWLLLRGYRRRAASAIAACRILKSRGMAHSNQIREFLITDHGVELRDVYVGPGGVLTGSARLAQEAEESTARLARAQDIERKQRELEHQRVELEARIAALRADFESREAETLALIEHQQAREARLEQERRDMAWSRKADAPANPGDQP